MVSLPACSIVGCGGIVMTFCDDISTENALAWIWANVNIALIISRINAFWRNYSCQEKIVLDYSMIKASFVKYE